MRFPHLAHRSAAARKLHSTPQQDRMNLISGKNETSSRLPGPFSLFLPGSCPNNRNRCRKVSPSHRRALELREVFFGQTIEPECAGLVTNLLVHLMFSPLDSALFPYPRE